MKFHTLTRTLIYGILVFTPLARGTVPGWATSLIFLASAIALAAFLLEKCLTWNWELIKTSLDLPIFSILGLCIISTGFSQHQYTSLWALVFLLTYVTIFYLSTQTVRTRRHFRRLLWVIFITASFLSIFGIFKFSGLNPFPWWDYPTEGVKISSLGVTATYVNRSHLAGYLEMAILLLSGYMLTGLNEQKRLVSAILLFFMIVALLLSLSRGGWMGYLAGLSLFVWISWKKRLVNWKRYFRWLSIGSAFLVLFVLSSNSIVERLRTFAPSEKMHSVEGRISAWKSVLEMIHDYPLFGTGPGTFSLIFTQYHPPGFSARFFMAHNDYLHFISEVGLPLSGLVVWMMVLFYRRGFQKLNHPSRLVRGMTLGAMSGVTAILIHSLFDFNLHIPANAILFTVLAAVTVAPPPARRAMITRGSRMPDRIYTEGDEAFPMAVPSTQPLSGTKTDANRFPNQKTNKDQQ